MKEKLYTIELNEIKNYAKQFGFNHAQPLFFIKKSPSFAFYIFTIILYFFQKGKPQTLKALLIISGL